jgi:hypothetical protein
MCCNELVCEYSVMTLCPSYPGSNISVCCSNEKNVHFIPCFLLLRHVSQQYAHQRDRNQRVTTIKPQYIIPLVRRANIIPLVRRANTQNL